MEWNQSLVLFHTSHQRMAIPAVCTSTASSMNLRPQMRNAGVLL